MIIKGVQIDSEIIAELARFTILMGLLEKEKCDYGRKIDLNEIAEEIERKKIPTRELAKAIRGRVDLYGNGVVVYVKHILEDPEKIKYEMTEAKREKVEKFIDSEGQESIVGGLIAIYRIRNNLFHGIKELGSLNRQMELFETINEVLEEIVDLDIEPTALYPHKNNCRNA